MANKHRHRNAIDCKEDDDDVEDEDNDASTYDYFANEPNSATNPASNQRY